MIREIEIQEYLEVCNSIPLIDVRSPGEFQKGRIPNAMNIPLFSDEERAQVGTVYTKQSAEKALELAYSYVNPKLESFIYESRRIAAQGKLAVHCWRGGMRSRTFAEHIARNGLKEVFIINNGYKAFRNVALNSYNRDAKIFVLGGYTGSGKTQILQVMKRKGHQVIDLETLANHKGSAFGAIGTGEQPSSEQFENNLFWEWKDMDFSKPIWIEDESHRLGNINIPMSFFRLISEKPVFFLDVPKQARAKFLVEEYAGKNKDALADSLHRISKRLGGMNIRRALDLLEKENYYEVAYIALTYYDKLYLKSLSARDQKLVFPIKLNDISREQNAEIIENYLETHFNG
jgi:tRNA 2-selenouridine synthase